jgi:hypothetical protein
MRSIRSAGTRIEFLSRQFLGLPYTTTLVGSAEQPELFIADLGGFDCVTYIETVLALARASDVDNFTEWLRKIRYDQGHVDWRKRNHYMTEWIRNNTRIGVLRPVSRNVQSKVKRRTLNVVPGFPPVRARFECIPKPAIRRISPALETGDLIFFASTRSHLDVFHCGVLIRKSADLRMRHASRSRKAVVEQELDEFLKTNRMAGVIVVRPAGELVR